VAAVTPPPPKQPPKPKVKVDLTQLVDGPAVERPPKPKVHPKKVAKTVHHPDELGDDADSSVASSGLSRDQIAEKLGAKLGDEGQENAVKTGANGSVNGHANAFSAFYQSISEQAHQEWGEMNPTASSWDSAIHATVQIHVERDGRVPPESVKLLSSSGNAAFDDSAVTAAENLGYLHEPLPEGCPPDISIIFNPKD
jgi:TonB family protein